MAWGFAKTLELPATPQQQMRIQQQLHSQASLSNNAAIPCSPMRSKSSGTLISPRRKPSRRTRPGSGASKWTTFTNGLPAFAMTKGSPRTRLLDQSREVRLGVVDIDTLRRAAFLN